ncbi:MAG: ABC transporter permease [Anaerolineae bacterium]|nr:ABC transporter permease [Anaerolineae bacterium]
MNALASSTAALRSRISPPLVALLLAIVLFFAGGLVNPDFVNFNQAINIVRLASFLGIIAAGQTLVIISGGEGIDLSAGAIVTLSAILVYRITNGANEMIPVALAVALAVGAFVGLVNGIGIILLGIPPLVMTLGMAGVVQGLILIVTQGQLTGKTPPLMPTLISNPLIAGIPGIIIIWVIIGVVMWLLLERSTYGKHLFAVGVNRTTARLSGVRVQRTVILTFTLSGLLAALGGFMLLGFSQIVFLNLGDPYLFPSIAAVVVGGTLLSGGKGSYWGTMSGALVLTLIDSLLIALRLQEAYKLIVLGMMLVILISIYGRQRGFRQ